MINLLATLNLATQFSNLTISFNFLKNITLLFKLEVVINGETSQVVVI